MKVEHIEVNMFVLAVQWLLTSLLSILLVIGCMGIIFGPLCLLSWFESLFDGSNDTFILVVGLIFITCSLISWILFDKLDIDLFDSIDSWFKRNFGHKVVKEIPDTPKNIHNYTNGASRSSKTVAYNGYGAKVGSSVPPERAKQDFGYYVRKEARKIIEKNSIISDKDKEAATFIAVNNVKHSPDVIASIYNISIDKANEIEESITVDEEKKVANHISYEGRIGTKDKNKMKSLLGYRCAACGKDMSEIYGNIGHNYIELHHLIPYSEMKENETRTLTEHEFCVLCPDCHRMIHKLPDASDIDMLIRIIRLNKK